MSQLSVSASTDAIPTYPRKWRIAGVLSLDLSPALLRLDARSKNPLFPLRPPAVKTALLPRIIP